MSKDAQQYLSRSALAEKLGVTLKELTQLMIESGWLIHNDSAKGVGKSAKKDAEKGKDWALTAKGEFEGGIYRESKKFGQYIVWPSTVLSHPAITGLSESTMSVTSVGKHLNLPAKTINKLFAELGWISPFSKGWQLNPLGQRNGGQQHSNDDSGIPYVTWSRQLLDNPVLIQQAQHFQAHKDHTPTVVINNTEHYQSLDGGYFASRDELHIAHALYLSHMSYAYQRTVVLSANDVLQVTFYLPQHGIYIFFDNANSKPGELSQQLQRDQIIKEHQLKAITLSSQDITNLDAILSKAFVQYGIVVG